MESSSSAAKRPGGDSTEHIPKKAKIEEGNIRKPEETHFSELVNITLRNVIFLKEVSKDAIKTAKRVIIDSFNYSKLNETRFNEINLSQWEYSCAYFYRYGAHGAGLTRHKVIKALENCEDLASKFEESNLNIFSFGGGPGNDIIGLCSALWESNVREKNLQITVTDLFPEWSSYVDLLKVFIKEGNFGNVSELFRNNKTTMSFLKAPSAGCPGSEKYLNALKNADVILMVKVLSIIKKDEKQDIVQSIYEGMKKDAFLIFIDCPFEDILWNKFERLYKDPYLGDDQHKYTSLATSTLLDFNDYNTVSSKAGIVVLRK